jgi:peptidoglycan/LPS O-acetylase OafA/YrhL
VAIAAVMFSHGFILADGASRTARAITYTAEYLGALGVSLFFAISGYLITTLLLQERESTGRISLGAFYVRRAFRILPPAYLYLLLLVLLAKPLRIGELASAAFFFSNYWPERSWFTQHFWSLSVEEHFYLLWPLGLTLVGPRRALRGAVLLIPVAVVWRAWSLTHFELPVPALQRTDMRLDAFLFASALAATLCSWRRTALLSILCTRGFRTSGLVILFVVSVWAVTGSAPATATLAQSVLLPALMVSLMHEDGSWLYRVLELQSLRWFGRISYGLYLWQQFFLVGHSAPTLGRAVRGFLPRVVVVVVVAVLSYYLMERPFLAFGRRLSQRIAAKQLDAFKIRSQVSCRNEPDAPNSEGSPGVRQRARSQAG